MLGGGAVTTSNSRLADICYAARDGDITATADELREITAELLKLRETDTAELVGTIELLAEDNRHLKALLA